MPRHTTLLPSANDTTNELPISRQPPVPVEVGLVLAGGTRGLRTRLQELPPNQTQTSPPSPNTPTPGMVPLGCSREAGGESIALDDTKARQQTLFLAAPDGVFTLPGAQGGAKGRSGGAGGAAQTPTSRSEPGRRRPGLHATAGHWHSSVLLKFAVA